jgi:GMP synthase-like glutamine amidotransferase
MPSPAPVSGARHGRVLVLQHLGTDGPAYLATWMHAHGVPFDVVDASAGQPFPDRLDGAVALAVLGGEMSANDPLPSLRQAEVLIREAVDRSRPVIGHCLGGQLLSRALGGVVGASPRPEIGWHAVSIDDDPVARDWFGEAPAAEVFQWHDEAFTLPAGARRLATNAACPNQAFAIGPHLGMQFHVEVDAAKLGAWFEASSDPLAQGAARSITADPGGAARCLAVQQALADRIYARWWASARG